MNIALLTAAGLGTRMNLELPKQFLFIEGKPVIVHTMQVFQNHPQIDAIIVVTLEAWMDTIKAYATEFKISKLKWIVPGGKTGQESIYCGIKELEKTCSPKDVIMIHDGNRPFVTGDIISDSFATYKQYGCAVAAIPCVEAIFRSSDGICSMETIPREELYRTQTPHTYSLEKLLWAHKIAKQRNIENTTATCVLMNIVDCGGGVYFSRGSEKNLKLTTQDDLDIFTALLKKQ